MKEEGTLITEGSNDILTMALGTPEQSGRVRGASMYYTPTTYFNLPRRGSRKHTEKLEAENQTLKVAVIELLKQVASSGSSPLNETIIELLRQQGMGTPRLSENVASNSAKSDNREHIIMTSEAHRSCGELVAKKRTVVSSKPKAKKRIVAVENQKAKIVDKGKGNVASSTLKSRDGKV